MVAKSLHRDGAACSECLGTDPSIGSGLPTSAVIALFVLPEYAVHHRNLVQGKEAAPDNGGAGRMIMLSCEIAAEFGHPQDDLCK